MSARFDARDFEGFKALARDASLSLHEKVGFPDSYRAGKEGAILRDIARKLPALRARGRRVLDIGSGCSPVAQALIALCRGRSHALTLVDSAEMLRLLPDTPSTVKIAGRFPDDCRELIDAGHGGFDAIVVYSVLQYVPAEPDRAAFVDAALGLLAERGRLLIGDLPSSGMRSRFFSSSTGRRFHRRFAGRDAPLPTAAEDDEAPRLSDDDIVSLLSRARQAGFHAWIVPQAADLPMANRREDLLFERP